MYELKMENNYRDHIENFIRESADSFLMVPSRRVWHGIYNNMHPDRRWPSMAVCLLILSAVMFIGVSNNNSLSKAARKYGPATISNLSKNNIPENSVSPGATNADAFTARTNTPRVNTPVDEQLYADNSISDNTDNIFPESNALPGESNPGNTVSAALRAGRNIFVPGGNNTTADPNDAAPNSNANIVYANHSKNIMNLTDAVPAAQPDLFAAGNQTAVAKKDNKVDAEKTALKLSSENTRSWKEDYAFRNKPAMNKFKDRSAITYYITPSIGYRQFTAGPYAKQADNINDKIKDHSALNLEVGAVIQYRIADRLRLKGGMQLNYTNYSSEVTNLGHSIETSLAVNRGNDVVSSSTYQVKPGPDRLNKSTVQVSVPLGADIKIAGRNKIKWYIGGTIQPSYLIGGSGYVLSQDSKFYIAEKSLLRRVNVSTAAETFVSYKASPGVTLSVGPQLRYQLLSTYKNDYNYSEKLYNLGVKIGLTTGF